MLSRFVRQILVAQLVKNLPAMQGSIPGLGRSPRKGNSHPIQCSVLENSMDCIVHGDSKSRTQLCNFQVCHSFSSKEQASFNFMAAVTICSDFGAQENKVSLFPLFPHLFAVK